MADLAFSQWTLELPGALTYAGLVRPESVVQNFIAYDPEAEGTPCLVQISVDDHLGLPTPPPVASALPSVASALPLSMLSGRTMSLVSRSLSLTAF